MLRLPAFAKVSAGLALSLACSSGEEMAPSVGIFVVTASGTAAPIVLGTAARAGDPSLFKLGFYRLYMSSATDCSGPNLLHNYGTRTDFDLLTSPTLFSLTGAPVGTYFCLIMRISDILEFVPVADDGPCVAGTTYHTDSYRAGETDWLDVNGSSIIGTGTDASPMDDKVDIFFSTNPAAVIGRGYSPSQVSVLGSHAIVPGTSTFYWDGSGGVVDDGGTCRMDPGTPPTFG